MVGKNFWEYKKLPGGGGGGGGAPKWLKGAQNKRSVVVNIFGSTKAPWGATSLSEKPKKSGDLFLFVLETVKNLYFVGAPFEFNGHAPLPPNDAKPPPPPKYPQRLLI